MLHGRCTVLARRRRRPEYLPVVGVVGLGRARGALAVTGITNKSLRALMTGLLGDIGYSMNQARYDWRA